MDNGAKGPGTMIGVVDTSALIRLFVPDGPFPDGLEVFLSGVERDLNTAIAPELLWAEAASVLLKKEKLGELTERESDQLLDDILLMPIRFFPHHPLLSRAIRLARKHGLTVYDTLYLALAEEHGAAVFSADRKMQQAAKQMQL